MARGRIGSDHIEVVELDEERAGDWMDLARRLMQVSPHKWKETIERVRAIVESQEIIARADGQLMLRDRRPTKRYRA